LERDRTACNSNHKTKYKLLKARFQPRRGETKRQAGDFVGAISDFDLALQLDPHDVSALRSRGDAKRMLDDFAGAIEDLDAALKLEPRNAFALRSRGDAKRMVDDHMGAIHDLDLALQLEPRNPVALSSRGDAKRMLEDSMGAIADLDIAIQMDPKNAFALSSRAASKRLMGDFLGAIADLDRALEMDPTDAFALRRRGEAKRLARDFVGAIQDLDLALVIEPANALALWRRGEAKRQQGDVMGAMGDLNLALQLEPINATALCSRSDTKLMLQDYMGAMEDLDAAVQLEPANAAALRSRGELKRLSGDFQGSIEDLDRSLQLEPQNAVALSSRGDAKRMLDDCQGALADLDLALELDPNNALDLARRGEVKREQGDFAGAINDLDFALELEPRNVVALSSRGDAKRMLNDCVGALEDLDLALQIEPDNPFALCCRGEAKKIEESRWFVQKADSLGPLNCLMSQQLKWAIIGAGPVGLTLALTLAESMQSRGLDPEVATVEIYLSWIEQDNSKWQRKRGTLSVEMVTLQDPVLDSLSPELRSAFTGGSSPRPSGRSAPVAGIEMKLLEKAQQPPFNTYIRIHDYAETDVQPMWLSSLCCDVIVSDSALTRRAFPGAFVNPAAPQVDVEAQQLPLSDAEGNESNLVEADFALGINLSFGASKQARFNAIFSMAQNIYQLSSDEVSDSGCLNIRITKEEYYELLDATGRNPESAGGSPIRLFGEEDLHLITDEKPSMLQLRLPWLRRRIAEGFKLYGLQLEQMTFITGVQLRPAYTQCFYHVLRDEAAASNGPKLLLLAGEAAIADHFWPCRGLNSGLKSAAAIVKMWLQCETLAEGAGKYNSFMDKLRRFEMQQRSAPRQQLPWGGALLRSMESPEAQSLNTMATEQEEVNMQSFLENCKLWRDFLQQSEGWPHESVTDEDLEEQLYKTIGPKELELHLMVSVLPLAPAAPSAAPPPAAPPRRASTGRGSRVLSAIGWNQIQVPMNIG